MSSVFGEVSVEDIIDNDDGVPDNSCASQSEVAGSGAVSDATSFTELPWEPQLNGYVHLDDLRDIETDLLPEDVARLMFLIMDDNPAIVLQKSLVKMRAAKSGKSVGDSFSEWALKSQNTNGISWQCAFLEGLAVIGRNDVLDILGVDSNMRDRLRSAARLSSLKVTLNNICCSLECHELKKLVKYMHGRHLPEAPELDFPRGHIIWDLLELYIMYWLQEKAISYTNMSALIDSLHHIKRDDLAHMLESIFGSSPLPPVATVSPLSSEKPEPVKNIPCLPVRPSVAVPPQLASCHTVTGSMPTLGSLQPIKYYPNSNGICIVFNQERFFCEQPGCLLKAVADHGYRKGSSVDATQLEETFRLFGCKTKVFHNESAARIHRILASLARANNLHQYDYLVLCFLSHGNTDRDRRSVIYSSDCVQLAIEACLEDFGGRYCRALAGKLKLVITQACQGYESLEPVSVGAHHDGPSMSTLSGFTTGVSDFLFCQATTPGYKAFRDPGRGSYYIQALCQVLRERGHLEEVTLCIKDVHHRVLQEPIYVAEERRFLKMQPQMIDRTCARFLFRRADDLEVDITNQ